MIMVRVVSVLECRSFLVFLHVTSRPEEAVDLIRNEYALQEEDEVYVDGSTYVATSDFGMEFAEGAVFSE